MFYLATDIKQQQFLAAAVNVEFSNLDDVVLIKSHNDVKPRFFNVAQNKEEKLPAANYPQCVVMRAQESEKIEFKEKAVIFYTV